MIKKYLKILTLFLGVLFTQSVNAAYETGEATEYQITVSKIELCATGSAIPTSNAAFSCLNPVTVSAADLDSAVDIGNDAIGAGEAAATLGNFGLASPGVTYTHLIATMKREIQITGKTANCSTKGDGTKATTIIGANEPTLWASAKDKYLKDKTKKPDSKTDNTLLKICILIFLDL